MSRQEEAFERELHCGLRRVEAPAGFLEAVMEAAEQPERSSAQRGRLVGFPVRRAWIGSLAASLLLGGLLFEGVEHKRAVERGRAERDFAQSLAITDRAMEHARQKMQQAGLALDD